MAQSLYISLRANFNNPTKPQLISMINLIHKTKPNLGMSVNYQIICPDLIQTKTLYGKVSNMKLLNYLASTEYSYLDIDIHELVKELK